MKKQFILFMLLTLPLFAQMNKGNISMLFNNEKISVPINMVLIQKGDDIVLSARGEINDSTGVQNVAMNFSLDKLASNNAKIHDIFLQITTRPKGSEGKKFYVQYGKNKTGIDYAENGKQINDRKPSFSLVMNIDSVEFTNDELIINGSCNIKYYDSSDEAQRKTLVTIKDFHFNIIL